MALLPAPGTGRADTLLLLLLLPGLLDDVAVTAAVVGSNTLPLPSPRPEAATVALVLTELPDPATSSLPVSRSLPAGLARWLEGRLPLEEALPVVAVASTVAPAVASIFDSLALGDDLDGDRMDLTGMWGGLATATAGRALCCNPRKSKNDGTGMFL